VLLARLRGPEPHRLRDPCPRQPCAAGREQQACFEPLDLGAGGGKQGERVQEVFGVQLVGTPEGELCEVDRRRRDGGWAPRAGRYRIRRQLRQPPAAS
jgi:hypothetical protein